MAYNLQKHSIHEGVYMFKRAYVIYMHGIYKCFMAPYANIISSLSDIIYKSLYKLSYTHIYIYIYVCMRVLLRLVVQLTQLAISAIQYMRASIQSHHYLTVHARDLMRQSGVRRVSPSLPCQLYTNDTTASIQMLVL